MNYVNGNGYTGNGVPDIYSVNLQGLLFKNYFPGRQEGRMQKSVAGGNLNLRK
jgi:hypothetical protein